MRKAITVIFAVAIVLLLWGASRPSKPLLWKQYTVVSGDTLWNIAVEHTPESRDSRKTLHLIESENGIDDSMIYPGQSILIPIWEE